MWTLVLCGRGVSTMKGGMQGDDAVPEPPAQALRASRRGMVPPYHRVHLLLQGISDHSFPPDRPMPGELRPAAQANPTAIPSRCGSAPPSSTPSNMPMAWTPAKA